MARILMGAIITDISGKLGGHTFGASHYGKTISTKSSGRRNSLEGNGNGNNPAGNIAIVSQTWKSLTDAQRQAWQGYAVSFCTTITLYGARTLKAYSAFSRCQHNRLLVGEPMILDPVAPTILTDLQSVYITTLSPTSFIVTVGQEIAPNELVIISATPSMSVGSHPKKNNYKLIRNADLSAVNHIECITEYTAFKGAPVLDAQIGVKVEVINWATGQRGTARVGSNVVS